MKEGKAIIALCGEDFAGFTYIESWGNKQYVATSGLIVHPLSLIHICLTGIVRGGDSHRVLIFCIRVYQIAAGGTGRFLNMLTLVHIVVYLQSVIPSRTLHELP